MKKSKHDKVALVQQIVASLTDSMANQSVECGVAYRLLAVDACFLPVPAPIKNRQGQGREPFLFADFAHL